MKRLAVFLFISTLPPIIFPERAVSQSARHHESTLTSDSNPMEDCESLLSLVEDFFEFRDKKINSKNQGIYFAAVNELPYLSTLCRSASSACSSKWISESVSCESFNKVCVRDFPGFQLSKITCE